MASRRSPRAPLPLPSALSGVKRRTASARGRGFDFTHHVRLVCQDMVQRLRELNHIDLARVAISFCQARKPVAHGLQAALTPMRFKRGQRFAVRNGRRVGVQQILDEKGNEMLYLLSFYLPRFLDLPFEEKLVTLLHELWHISPAFDGDLRRHPGRCYIHTGSERHYDAMMADLARRWLSLRPPVERYEFLQFSFDQLRGRHGAVYGTRIPAPRLIPADLAANRD